MHLSLKGGAWRNAQRVHEAEWVQHHPATFAGLSVWFQHIKPSLSDYPLTAKSQQASPHVAQLFPFCLLLR